MPQTVVIVHDYPVAPKVLWELIIDADKFHEIMAGIVEFEGMPSGTIHQEQIIDVQVSLFGKLPKQPYRMHVTHMDETKLCFHSSETGAGVKSWEHFCSIHPTKDGCQLRDKIEIDAGMMTPLFAMWANFLYKARHKPRLKLLGVSD